MHMLRHVVGDENFWTILNTYYETYRYGNASIPEFQNVCETVAAMDLDWFFQEWIYDMGYPKIQYAWTAHPSAAELYQVTVNLNQYQSVGSVFRMPVDIRVVGAESDMDTTVWMNTDFDSYTFFVDNPPLNVDIDPDGWILMDLEYLEGGLKRSEILPERICTKAKSGFGEVRK